MSTPEEKAQLDELAAAEAEIAAAERELAAAEAKANEVVKPVAIKFQKILARER